MANARAWIKISISDKKIIDSFREYILHDIAAHIRPLVDHLVKELQEYLVKECFS